MSQFTQREIGPRRPIPALEDAKDHIAEAINRKIERDGMTLHQFLRRLRLMHGFGPRKTQEVSSFLRGAPNSRWGVYAAFDFAQTVGIPIRFDIGDDARTV